MATTELLKKVLYTGVGVVSTTTDRVKKSIEELSQVSEEAQEEGKKKVDVATDELNTRREEMSARFKKVVDTVLSQFDFPNRTESETLNAKIAELEERLATKKKTVRKAAKKTATKAKTTAKAVVAEVKEMVKK
jgi:polyhydroxyalkanoate synthesis regulator phasin